MRRAGRIKVKVVHDIIDKAGQGNRILPDGGRTDAIVDDPIIGKLKSNEAN